MVGTYMYCRLGQTQKQTHVYTCIYMYVFTSLRTCTVYLLLKDQTDLSKGLTTCLKPHQNK